ncbi:MAG TPA: class I SAM-dependent methyltransferase [Stellaceae bacterium]|nr:class I SAM-dependent methyltransferase [Stellaceae bacterium]
MTGGAPATRRIRPRLLGSAFFSDSDKHRLNNRGAVDAARDRAIRANFKNLNYLLAERYHWMKSWIDKADADLIVEIGAGAGLSRRYLGDKIILSDVTKNSWINIVSNGREMPFRDESLDVIIASNVIHHLAEPAKFFYEALRVLKMGGLVLINEAYCSLLLRVLLRVLHHEGYSYDVDVFDPNAKASDAADPWSGNNAVSNLLFDSPDRFESTFPDLRMELDAPSECLLFIISGGVTSTLPVPELPDRFLTAVDKLDRLLVGAAPRMCALSRRTVLRKTGSR